MDGKVPKELRLTEEIYLYVTYKHRGSHRSIQINTQVGAGFDLSVRETKMFQGLDGRVSRCCEVKFLSFWVFVILDIRTIVLNLHASLTL